jgi:hypothetical protein
VLEALEQGLSCRRRASARVRLVAGIAFEIWRERGERGTFLRGGVLRRIGPDAIGDEVVFLDLAGVRLDEWRSVRLGDVR